MRSSLAWAAPAKKTATAPTQVVSRKLRIGILPATVPRVTDARALRVPRVGIHSAGRTSGSVSQRNGGVRGTLTFWTYAAPGLRGYVRTPVTPNVLEAGSRKKPIPATNRPQPKTFNTSFSAQALLAWVRGRTRALPAHAERHVGQRQFH